ncbi:hypothetical protein LQZ44_11995 [Alcaligenes nematophilus]|uniref:Uncharacterized protein n=1 Tax=Alcaligenes faecalis TaxID=511 RepID=A0A2U2BHL6_ALCFA|nr:hypothetical protein [Alcaligenes faecalis]PWE13467.1 hypothetical protein DF183_16845 [Alcaligenes faecalis]ULH08226.1 hypothetical protein MF263_07175 [Alcaligenes faecalis]
MAKYQVVRAWHGVTVGQVVEMEKVHPSLKANVIPLTQAAPVSDEAGDLLKQAKAEIDAMRERAQAELAQRVEEAKQETQAEADRIISEATAEAERIKQDAQQKAGELTPATPDAGSKQTKAK